jgi:succinoglycan biosynthesis protein ExoV
MRPMKICRHPVLGMTAADGINQWLWPRLMPELCGRYGRTLFLGAGGLVDAGNPSLDHYPRVVVFGAGARGPATLPDTAGDWDIRFVRGPETARAMGLPSERWLCDPAVLAPKLHCARVPRQGPRRIALALGGGLTAPVARALAKDADLVLLRPDQSPEAWIDRLLDCDAALCADQTVAAVADAYGIPWRQLRLHATEARGPGDTFEWLDWTKGMALVSHEIDLPDLSMRAGPLGALRAAAALRRATGLLRKAKHSDLWSLSDRTLLRLRQQALTEEIADLRLRETAPRRQLRVVRAMP